MVRQNLEQARTYWNQEAATFDEEPDHGLRDPIVYAAWQDLLTPHLPTAPAQILDIGCGTGSISVLLARLGHHLTGIDLSPEMIARAKQKAEEAGRQINFMAMDAAHPRIDNQKFDVLLCRHLLWALPEPKAVLARWARLLNAGGKLALIEGYWNNAGGLHAEELIDALPDSATYQLQDLGDQPALWGGEVADERYLVVANLG